MSRYLAPFSGGTLTNDLTLSNGADVIGLRDRGGQVHNIRAYGAAGNGITDDQPAMQAAIDAGGGVVSVPPGTYAIAATVVLKNDVVVELATGARLLWTGAAGGTMVTSPISDPLVRSGLTGGVLDANNLADVVVDLHSPQFSRFGDWEARGGRATTTALRIRTDATNASGYLAKRNAMFNTIGPLLVNGACATALDLAGAADGLAPVTLNHIHDIEAGDVRGKGIRIVEGVDNNLFSGFIRLSITANNAVGLIVNDSATPASDVRVYSNQVLFLAVDAFANGSTGRKGVILNKSKLTTIRNCHINPEPEGGAFDLANADSYDIQRTGRAGTTRIDELKKNAAGLHYTTPDTPAAIANTIAETTFATTTTLTANALTRGKVLRVTLRGVVSTAAAGASLTLRIKLGPPTYLTTGAVALPASLSNRGWELTGDLLIKSDGATAFVEPQGFARIATTTTDALIIDCENAAAVSADLTLDRVLAATAQWSVADAANSVTLKQMIVEVLER